MKWFCLLGLMICLVLCLISCASVPQKAQEGYRNEPDGFRGIKWGTDLHSLSGFVSIDLPGTDDSSSPLGDIKIFVREKDDLHFGKANLTLITYSFWANKLLMVSLLVKGKENWNRLKDTAFDKFGKSVRGYDYESAERHEWHGAVAHIGMEFWESTGDGYLMMYSKKLMYERFEKSDQNKAKEEEQVNEEKQKR